MVVTYSTFIGRVKRRKAHIIVVSVRTIDAAATVVRLCEQYKQPLILSFEVDKTVGVAAEVFVAALYRIADHSSELCILQIHVLKHEKSSASILGAPIQVIYMHEPTSETAQVPHIRKTATRALAISGSWPWNGNHLALTHQMMQADVDVAVLTSKTEISLKQLAEVVTSVRMPVLLKVDTLTPRETKRLLKSGIRGVFLDQSALEAYTAGIRTGIRNRSQYDPAQYMTTANSALEASLGLYLALLQS